MTLRHLAVAAALLVLTPIAAYAQYYSRCDVCADQLGGRRVAGPYPDEKTCIAYVQQMRAEGFPFELPCYTGGAPEAFAPRARSLNLSKAERILYTTGVGMAGGAVTGWALAAEPDARDWTVKGGAVGAVWGAALAYAVTTPYRSLPARVLTNVTIFSPLVGAAVWAANATDEVNRETYAMQGAAAAAVVVTVFAFVVDKQMSSGFRRADTNGRGWRRHLRLFTAPILQPGAPGWTTFAQLRW